MPVKPSSQTLTLRLKHHKTTVLLHVERTQSFTSIAADLLTALRQRYPDGQLNSSPIPQTSSPARVRFAQLKDESNTEAGWSAIETSPAHEDAADDGPRKKRKASSGGGGGGKSVLVDDCPLAVGLKDNALLAFRFVGDRDDGEAEGDADELGIGAREDWDVVLPGFDDEAEEVEEDIEVPEVDGV